MPLGSFIWSIGLGWKTFPRRRWDRDVSSGSWKTNAFWAPGDCAQPCFRMTGSGVSSVQCALSKKNEELQQVNSKAHGERRQSWGHSVAAHLWQRTQVTSAETRPGVMPHTCWDCSGMQLALIALDWNADPTKPDPVMRAQRPAWGNGDEPSKELQSLKVNERNSAVCERQCWVF